MQYISYVIFLTLDNNCDANKPNKGYKITP